jgi:sRNA-binding protein
MGTYTPENTGEHAQKQQKECQTSSARQKREKKTYRRKAKQTRVRNHRGWPASLHLEGKPEAVSDSHLSPPKLLV